MSLTSIDLAIVGTYAILLFAIAIFVSREPAGETKDTEDYFLAGKALPWWAIGASLIAANISAEQIIGQSGQGFVVGLAIAAYEWQAAIVLLIVAKFFLPIFLERNIYTMPQFLETRFGGSVKSVMAVFWIALYTTVNLTAILYAGALAIQAVTGLAIFPAMAMLAAFAALYSLYGGLKAVALTDIIQVVILITGGFVITWVVLGLVGGEAGAGAGLSMLFTELPGHFEMMLSSDHPSYGDLPGIWTLLGGLWVLHFSYWGFNQYIIQRALGAESLAEAQKGLAFAAFLKLLIPLIVVIPGVAALYLAQQGALDLGTLQDKPDSTYGMLMTLVPSGLRGLVFAALIAAVVSSLASMMNSISTIFTMDVYRDYIAGGRSESHYVFVGRATAFTAMVLALLIAQPFLGGDDSVFQTIQEYTGFVAPGVVAVFLLGFFWKRTNAPGAFALLISSVALNLIAMIALPHIPFVLRIWIVFLICLVVGVVVSLLSAPPREDRPVDVAGISFDTRTGFNISAILIALILVLIYVVFW
ncbi:MAG: sodium/solute symporter [Pseudomonadota bacterium]